MSKPLKAYMVRDDYEGNACIVFAKGGAQARREGANELGIDWESVESCTRKPEFDQYAEAGTLPNSVLIEDGWWFECSHCYRRISKDLKEEVFDEGLNPDDFEIVDTGKLVFCSHSCRAIHYREGVDKARAKSALVEYVTTKWAGTHVVHAHVYKDKLEPSGERGGIKCSASFTFPGGRSQVQWVFPQDTVLVCQFDVEAWHAFVASNKAGVSNNATG